MDRVNMDTLYCKYVGSMFENVEISNRITVEQNSEQKPPHEMYQLRSLQQFY